MRQGPSPVEALRRHFLDGLERCDPVTGLNDHPEVLAYQSMLYGTPALAARLYGYLERSEAALAEALGGGLDARLAAERAFGLLEAGVPGVAAHWTSG